MNKLQFPATLSEAIVDYRDSLKAGEKLSEQARVLNVRAIALEKKIIERTCDGREIHGHLIIQVDGTLWRIDPAESPLCMVTPIEDFTDAKL